MSAKQPTKTKTRGRKPTGSTKDRPSLTIDKKLLKECRKLAKLERSSISAWVEQSIAERISRRLEMEAAQ